MPDDYLASLVPEDRAARYDFSGADPRAPQTIVAVDGTCLVGFATIGPADAGDPLDTGQLLALYVDPGALGQGFGRALVEHARMRLAARGCSRAVLWVLVGNVRAERFYEKDGWSRSGGRRTQRVWGLDVDEVQFDRPLC